MTAGMPGVVALACAAALAACEPVTTSVGSWEREASVYLEAERGELSGGFSIGDDSAASNGRFIAPPNGVTADAEPGSARAVYAFSAAIDGDYVLWGRLRAPGALANRFWIRLDDGPWTKWRISVGDIWYWDDVHEDANYGSPLTFTLSAGRHELAVANAVDGVALDRLFLSPSGEIPPGNDTPCNPPHSIDLGGECLPSCGSLNGTACDEATCAGRELLNAYDCGVCCHVEP